MLRKGNSPVLWLLLRQSFRRWHGLTLCVAALVSTVWLAISNQLILYIHPRYVVFTVVMTVLGLLFVIASLARKQSDGEQPAEGRSSDVHTHSSHDHTHAAGRPLARLLSIGASILTIAVGAALIVVPPATLTTATANQRMINSTDVGSAPKTLSAASSAPQGASAKFSVLDWASLLRQTTDSSFFANKTADVVGFITKDADDPENMFFVSRFVITCCAVDAQPVGVPVYLPNWQAGFAAGDWVKIGGSFGTNPSSKSTQPTVVIPEVAKKVGQPSEPYLY